VCVCVCVLCGDVSLEEQSNKFHGGGLAFRTNSVGPILPISDQLNFSAHELLKICGPFSASDPKRRPSNLSRLIRVFPRKPGNLMFFLLVGYSDKNIRLRKCFCSEHTVDACLCACERVHYILTHVDPSY